MISADEALKLSPEFDLQELQNMEPTLNLLRDVGAL
jgi:iron(III) transport system substrate-binding protein